MTWSLIARDATGAFGVAVASRFFAVGALCPHAASGVGALATQALVNPLYAPAALEAMAQRRRSRGDRARADRRRRGPRPPAAAPDRPARAASPRTPAARASTGAAIAPVAAIRVAGNMLAGPQVLDDTAAAFEANQRAAASPLRLIVAMEAGEAAGGDKRGKQAAALIVCTTETYPGARPARRRPRRADRRIAPPVREEPRALPAVRRLPAPPRRSRRASPTAPSSRPKSSASRRHADRAGPAPAEPRRSPCYAESRQSLATPREATHADRTLGRTRHADSPLGSFGLGLALALAARLAAPAHAQTLRIGLAEDPDVLDPTLARTFVGRIVFAALCDKLFDIDEKLAHRAAARDLVRVVGRQQGADAEDAARRHVPRRREARRRRGQVQHRAAQDDGRARTAAASSRSVTTRRRRRSDDRAPQPVGAVRAAPRPARRPRRDDGLAQGRAGRRRQVRRQARLLGPVPLRRARRAGPHRRRALSELLEQGRDPRRPDRLPADRRLDGAPRQPQVGPARLHRAAGAVRRAGAQDRHPLQDREDHRDRLPGHHDQRRQERPRAEESARQGSARARGVRARARPRGHRAGRDGRRRRRSATSGSRRPTRSTRRTCRSRSATSRARRRCSRKPACPIRASR